VALLGAGLSDLDFAVLVVADVRHDGHAVVDEHRGDGVDHGVDAPEVEALLGVPLALAHSADSGLDLWEQFCQCSHMFLSLHCHTV
jgi:hypothetical protein